MIEPISSSVTTLKYNRRDSMLRNSNESIVSTIQNEENLQEGKGQYESQDIQNSQQEVQINGLRDIQSKGYSTKLINTVPTDQIKTSSNQFTGIAGKAEHPTFSNEYMGNDLDKNNINFSKSFAGQQKMNTADNYSDALNESKQVSKISLKNVFGSQSTKSSKDFEK